MALSGGFINDYSLAQPNYPVHQCFLNYTRKRFPKTTTPTLILQSINSVTFTFLASLLTYFKYIL